MNYEKAEKRLSDMKEKDILNDNDYEFLAEIAGIHAVFIRNLPQA